MTQVAIWYHAKCMDGTGSRYAAWKKFGDNASYHACQYGSELPEHDPETEIYMLDFSVSREALESLRNRYKRVVVIDHHVTAQEALQGLPDVVFDMSKSGAVLSWEYFFPNHPVPMLLQFIQDRDLWQFKFGKTQQIHAGLGTLKGNMEVWSRYTVPQEFYADGPRTPMPGTPLATLAEKGQILLDRDRDAVADKVPSMVKVIDFLGYKAGIINTVELVSETGDAICRDETLNVDLALMWVTTLDGGAVISMRSLPGSTVHVGNICKRFNGGGHQGSAGCRVSLTAIQNILNGDWAEI